MPIKLSNEISLWARRLALYFSLYVLIIVSHLFFKRFDWWHTDVDSARYMLSALVQGEAAIVALVVTLSLVAVQLAAQSYSARVIEVFRRTPDLWILMGIYGGAIFYGLGVLKLIERANPVVNSLSNLEGHIAFSYYLGVFAFVALVPYILKIFDMLNPIKLINILKEDITQENILAGNKDGKRYPLQPIIEIINGALERYDYEIFDIGLDRISECANSIFKNNTFKNSDWLNVSIYFFNNLVIVGKLAVNRKDEKAAFDVIYTMREIADTLAEQGLDAMTAGYFEDIGILATGNDMENVVVEITHSLEKIGVSAINNELFLSAEHVVDSFEKLRENILGGNFINAPRKLISSLGEIGDHLTKNKQRPDITWKVISCLNELKIPAFELGIVKTLISAFRQIAAATVIHESEDIYQITSSLLSIQETAYERFNEIADEVTENIIIDLKFIGVLSIRKHHLKNASINIIDSLKDAGIKAIEHNTNASYLSPSYLGQLGDITIEEKQNELTELIITRLNEIREKAQEYGSWQTEEKADTGINKLTQALNKG